jgi:3-hydroxyacyl-[acyl-carrier-protein] dehydratase
MIYREEVEMDHSESGRGKTWRGTFFFDPGDAVYADHFPGNPVVPGSLVVHAFITAAEKNGIDTSGCRLENFRFRRFVAPGEYGARIRRSASGKRMVCELVSDGRVLAAGVLNL